MAARDQPDDLAAPAGAERASPALGEQFGGQQRCFVAALPADADNKRMGGRVGELVEPALQHGGRRLGIGRVVTMLAWPRKCCRSVMSIPRASSRVAIVCRSR
jgi:hypothetical protein